MSRPPYVRPSIVRHHAGGMNKMGPGPAATPQSHIGGVDVEALVAAYGSPLFVYRAAPFRQAMRALRDGLARRLPKVALAWSHKTCGLDAICALAQQEGALAEVVSGMEYRRARLQGYSPPDIVYNGPHKDVPSLTDALLGGSIVHLDHFDELAQCEAIAQAHDRTPNVGLRLSMDIVGLPRWDRFGFHLDSGQAWDAVRRLQAGGCLNLTALHCHLGTFILDPDAYAQAATRLATFANRLRQELGIVIESIDLGGGLASQNHLRGHHPGSGRAPALDTYAAAIAEGLGALDPELSPLILVESGRALIDEAGTLITTVIARKRLADGRPALVVDGGVNLLPTAHWYQHQLRPTRPRTGAPGSTMVYGPLCMNIDVVGNNVMLPPLSAGDRLLASPVGAYNLSQSMQFIDLRPAVCLIGADGQHGLIRRAETLDDLRGPERVPDWLARG